VHEFDELDHLDEIARRAGRAREHRELERADLHLDRKARQA
jgi:hypothetical protein